MPRIAYAKILRCVSIVLAIAGLAGTSCFRERRTVTQVDDQSDVRFTGNTDDAEFRLERDGRELWPWTEIDEDQLYRTTPGRCEIMVRKENGTGDRIVVRRQVLLTGGQVFEVAVP